MHVCACAQMSRLCMLTGIGICMYIICIYGIYTYNIYISTYIYINKDFNFPFTNAPKMFGIFLIHSYYEIKSLSFLTSTSTTWIFSLLKNTYPHTVFSQRWDISTLGRGCLCFFLLRKSWQLLSGEELLLFKFLLGYSVWNLESRH